MTDYKVGYGKPPEHTRFKPGSPRLRANAESAIDALALLDKPLTAKREDKLIKIHPHQAELMALGKKALQGNMRAIKIFLKACEKAGLFDPPRHNKSSVVAIPKELDFDIGVHLVRLAGPPPWPVDLYDRVKAEYEHDCAYIERLHREAEKKYGIK